MQNWKWLLYKIRKRETNSLVYIWKSRVSDENFDALDNSEGGTNSDTSCSSSDEDLDSNEETLYSDLEVV